MYFLKTEEEVFVCKSQSFAKFINKSPREMYALASGDMDSILPISETSQTNVPLASEPSNCKKVSRCPENKQTSTERYCPVVGLKSVGDSQRSFQALMPVHIPSLQSCQDYVVGKKDILWKLPWRCS